MVASTLLQYFGIATLMLTTLVILLALFLKLYNKRTCGMCRSYRNMKGKTVIITGEPSKGAVKEIALNLGLRSAKVIIACKDHLLAKKTADEIIKRTGNGKIIVKHLDISSLFSIRVFVQDIVKTEKRLDVLIHNAGVSGSCSKLLTADDQEITFVTNYLGPFLLTELLLDFMKTSAPSRIIFVSSVVHFLGRINFDNLNSEKHYNRYRAYCTAKLAVNIITHEFARRLQGTQVTVNSLHPGIYMEDFYQDLFFPVRWFLQIFTWLFLKNTREVAQTSIHLAVSEEVEKVSGEYFAECKKAKESSRATNQDVAKRLWEASLRLTEQQV